MTIRDFVTSLRDDTASKLDVDKSIEALVSYSKMEKKDAEALIKSISTEKNSESDLMMFSEAMMSISLQKNLEEEKEESVEEPSTDGAEAKDDTVVDASANKNVEDVKAQVDDAGGEENKEEEEVVTDLNASKSAVDSIGKELRSKTREAFSLHKAATTSTNTMMGVNEVRKVFHTELDKAINSTSGGVASMFSPVDNQALTDYINNKSYEYVNSDKSDEMVDAHFKGVDDPSVKLTKAVNTLATAGANNISVLSSVATAIMALALTDQGTEYGLASAIPNSVTDSNKVTGQIVTEASYSARTQGTAIGVNAQGSVTSFTCSLSPYSAAIGVDRTALMAEGDPIGVFTRSLVQGFADHKSGLLQSTITGSGTLPTGVNSFGLGATKALNDLTIALWEGFVATIKGPIDSKSLVLSQGGKGVMRSITIGSSDARPLFTEYPYNLGTDILGGLRFVGDDNFGTAADAKNTTDAKQIGIIGNLARGARFYINLGQEISGVGYDTLKNQLQIYSHILTGSCLTEPKFLGVLATKTA